MLDIERYPITASVSHLTCPLPPHQSFDLPTATTSSVRTGASARDRASTSARHRASTSTRHRALSYHCISQSFDLSPATTSVSHQSELVLVLEIELVLALDIEHYHITTSGSHLTCPLPPHQSNDSARHRALLYHHISQSFDLPSTTTSPQYCITTSVSHLTCPHHHISQSFDLPTANTSSVRAGTSAPATTPVSLLTCPLPLHSCINALPHQSVIGLAHCHHIGQSFDLPSTTASLHYHIGQSFDLPPPPHQSVI